MITQLIYMSQPFGYDSATLSGILATARRNNPQHGLTGALICRQDIYLQMLEGPAQAIDSLFERIAADPRHLEVKLLSRSEVASRMFPDWAMLHDPSHTWHWSPDDVSQGAIAKASVEELQSVFRRVAA
ncbi:blue light sensor protein [Novosphingobium sp. AAP83]|uniref:BLUF domain-containing protein n=1 Tax=Novosphingobium sp. AAP83 TaxID=1523425 RepID=UPI0006B8B440|nr:BLUF domain-containing protein [Novosphingobium sp. AAP83]KPF93621.1 blue light sensor protein [Novosphingobium sp. AAP83]